MALVNALGRRLKKRGSGEEAAVGEAVRLHDKAKVLFDKVQQLDFESKGKEGHIKALEGEVAGAKAALEAAQEKIQQGEEDLRRLMNIQAEELSHARASAVSDFQASLEYQQALEEARKEAVVTFKASSEYAETLTYERQKVVYPFLKKAVLELEARLPLETPIQLQQVPSLSRGYLFLNYKQSLDDFLKGESDEAEDEEDEEEEEGAGEGEDGEATAQADVIQGEGGEAEPSEDPALVQNDQPAGGSGAE